MKIFLLVFILLNAVFFIAVPYCFLLGDLLDYINNGLLRLFIGVDIFVIHVGLIGYLAVKIEDKVNNWRNK